MKKIILLISWMLFIWNTLWVYYHPNPEIAPYLEDVTEKFIKITSYANTPAVNIPTSLFAGLAEDFSILKNKLPQTKPNFRVIYENCYLISSQLAQWFSRVKFDTFNAQCFWPWKRLINELVSNYAVKAKIKAYPKFWNAPLTVTFDARSSIDPSSDTIPVNNYYWYYKNSKWQEILIWQWPVVKYTFDTANNYVVHLTVKSSNKQTEWILDWAASITISVAPRIANIVLYVNWEKATLDRYIKLSTKEADLWVLFDATSTTPSKWTKIISSKWEIKKDWKVIYQDTIWWLPWVKKIKLPWKWTYFISLTLRDNTDKIIKKTYKIIVSDPVAIIKINPKVWTTSTLFNIDGSVSYSLQGKITSYKWYIAKPDGKREVLEGKKFIKYKFPVPWMYSITLSIKDVLWNSNTDTYKLQVDSTSPTANFIFKPYDNWEKPSTFIFDASYSYDIDEAYWDYLTYKWSFWTNAIKTQYINNGEKVIAQFNKKWVYRVTLTVKDKYWKTSSITKEVKVLSTLRPKLEINPNYTILWEPIQIKVVTNKPVAYFEYNFGDKKIVKSQSNIITHTYKIAGIYRLVVKAYSIDGDSNSIITNIFIGQRWYPLAIYKVIKENKVLSPTAYCMISCKWSEWEGCEFAPAYEVPRLQDIKIDARNSINSQWIHDMLKIYFKKSDNNEYIVSNTITARFDELGCKKVTLYVKDLNNNKLDKKDIYFKVVDALPVLKDLKMYFPQYGWTQNGTFRPRIWGANTLPKDIFAAGFDPLLVKLQAINAYDPDSPMLSYFRWYYYKKWDRSNLIDVKITPYNIPEVVFAIPRIPWQYIFGVDVCDVDGKCTNSEEYLHLKPIVDIPPSAKNPDIPQVNSVRIDYNGIKWIGEVNVGDEVTIHVDTTILSKKSDFYSSKTIKYDFDNDGKYDLTTKKDVVKHIYTKPWKYRVKVKVIYRGYGGIGYSAPLIVKKWLKPMVDLNYKWQSLIFNDFSIGDIKEKKLCFDIRKCRKDSKNFLFENENYGYVYYPTTGLKLLFFKYKDDYWNEKTLRKKIKIKADLQSSYLLTLPKAQKKNDNYKVLVAWMYKNWFVLYYKSNNKNCYIDKDISIDTDKNGSTLDDKDLICNHIYKLSYISKPEVILMIHDWNTKKKLVVDFANMQNLIPAKFQTQYEQIQRLIYKYSDYDSDKIQYFIKMLWDLASNLDDITNRDAILLQLQTFIEDNKWLISEDDEKIVESLISSLSDIATNAALTKDDSVLQQAKQEILLILSVNQTITDKLNDLFAKLDQTSSKDERKQILQQIMDIALNEKKDWNIDDESLQMIKSDICSLLKYYEIPSKLCGTAIKENVSVSNSNSLMGKVVKIILIVLIIVVVLFIILVIIFMIKAKMRKKELIDNDDIDDNDDINDNDDIDDNDDVDDNDDS